MLIGGREVPATISIGVAVHRGGADARTASELPRDADAAMYRAKDLGRGRVELFDSELHRRALARLDARRRSAGRSIATSSSCTTSRS
jgi:predicted signal transduction protein with EAL and GGDEF domain